MKLLFPPSTNHYLNKKVRKGKGGKMFVHVELTTEAHEYHYHVFNEVSRRGLMGKFKNKRCEVEVVVNPPDCRRRDLDNYAKVMMDSLTFAKLWDDDECVDRLTLIRGDKGKPGSVVVSVSEAG